MKQLRDRVLRVCFIHDNRPEYLVEILEGVSKVEGYLSIESLEIVSSHLGLPREEVVPLAEVMWPEQTDPTIH